MKKYIAAGGVAVVAFAFAASAASLNVDGGTLQAGTDSDLACYDDANVTYATGYNQRPNGTEGAYDPEEPFRVQAITVELSGGDEHCRTETLRGHLKVNNGDHDSSKPHGYAITAIDDDSFTVQVRTAGVDDGSALLVRDLHQVQVMVKDAANQGEADGYFSGVFANAGN